MRRIGTLLGIALLLCSCGTTTSIVKRTFNGDIYRVDQPWWDSRETFEPPEDCRDMLDLATYRFPEDAETKSAPVPEPCKRTAKNYTPGDTTLDPTKLAYYKATLKAEDRDRLQDKLLALSNRECEEHHSAIVGTNAGANFGLATLTSLFSGGATAFAAESTKTALAAVSTLFGATRSHFNESFYRQLFVGTILQAIQDDRQTALLNISDKRRYPVPAKVESDPRLKGLVIAAIEKDDNTSTTTTTTSKTDTTNTIVTPSNTTTTKTTTTTKPATTTAPNPVPPTIVPALTTGPNTSQNAAPRLHYSIDEAIRDAEDYHGRCSFYQGLVRVATTVQQASPCVTARQRRDQILAEISAITASSSTGTVPEAFKAKVTSLQKELEKIETKVLTCVDAAQ